MTILARFTRLGVGERTVLGLAVFAGAAVIGSFVPGPVRAGLAVALLAIGLVIAIVGVRARISGASR